MGSNMFFNGINGATGNYLLPEMSAAEISKIAQGDEFDKEHLAELKHRFRSAGMRHLRAKEGVDPKNLAQAGWGIIFAHDDRDRVAAWKEALKPLLDLRKEQAGDLYKEYTGGAGYRPGESKSHFLARHKMGPGPADPDKVPYYLLIVADPETIPFRFQYQLDVQYAVGRIFFDTLEEYANYAQTVDRAEKGEFPRSAEATFFGVQNPADQATKLSAVELVQPLADWMTKDKPDWSVQAFLKEEATKAKLAELFNSPDGPALLFTASHGMGFPNGDPRQLPHQGSLLCQDWPGPLQWRGKPIPEEHYFSADDVGADAAIGGMINFHFACYGAGTPQRDDFAHRAFQERTDIAPHAFISRLPQRLLSHPKGGTLAVIGHVERAWGCSFIWEKAGAQREVFQSTLKRLTEGHPVGSAIEYFNERYAELSTTLTEELEDIKFDKTANDLEVAGMWIANNDARGYAIIGDPAVRLPIGSTGKLSSMPRNKPSVLRQPIQPVNVQSRPASEAISETAEEPTVNTSYAIDSTSEQSTFTVTTYIAADVEEAEGKKIAAQTKFADNAIETVVASDHAGNVELLALHCVAVEKVGDARFADPNG